MSLLGDRSEIAARTPLPVQDVTNATSKSQITSESVSFSNGVAGTTQRIKLTYDGVMSEYGERIGRDGDTSISWGTGTILATEVPWKYKNVAGKDNEEDRLRSLSNGEYMVDYENGFILGKNASTTSSTTDTISYKIRLSAASVVGDLNIETVAVSSTNADAYSKDSSVALEASSVSKATSGNFFKAVVRLDRSLGSGLYYFQLLDAATVPADGSVTFLMIPVKIAHVTGTDSYVDIDAAPGGLPAATGIVWCVSSTEFTKTVIGNFASVTVAYK